MVVHFERDLGKVNLVLFQCRNMSTACVPDPGYSEIECYGKESLLATCWYVQEEHSAGIVGSSAKYT